MSEMPELDNDAVALINELEKENNRLLNLLKNIVLSLETTSPQSIIIKNCHEESLMETNESDTERLERIKKIELNVNFLLKEKKINSDWMWLIKQAKRVTELEKLVEGYRSNWYKCVDNKTENQPQKKLKVTPKETMTVKRGWL